MKARQACFGLAFSAAAVVCLTQFEGFRDKAYIPVPGDVPTLGYGTTKGVKLGDTITKPEAIERLRADVNTFEGAIKQCVTVPLHQHEYDAFVSLAYNIGPGAFCNSTLVRKLNAGDYAGACAEISRWTRAGGREVKGLVSRRAAERAQCEGQP